MDEHDVTQAILDLRQRVNALEAQVAALTGQPAPVSAYPATPTGGPETDPQVLEMLRQGNEIGAIKAWRERTGSGLAEAKAAVDQARARLHL